MALAALAVDGRAAPSFEAMGATEVVAVIDDDDIDEGDDEDDAGVDNDGD